jgi:hypothetical protein
METEQRCLSHMEIDSSSLVKPAPTPIRSTKNRAGIVDLEPDHLVLADW